MQYLSTTHPRWSIPDNPSLPGYRSPKESWKRSRRFQPANTLTWHGDGDHSIKWYGLSPGSPRFWLCLCSRWRRRFFLSQDDNVIKHSWYIGPSISCWDQDSRPSRSEERRPDQTWATHRRGQKDTLRAWGSDVHRCVVPALRRGLGRGCRNDPSPTTRLFEARGHRNVAKAWSFGATLTSHNFRM